MCFTYTIADVIDLLDLCFCRLHWNIGYKPLVFIQLCLVLSPPSSFSCSWILLSSFLFLDLFSMCPLVSVFFFDLALSTVMLVWQWCSTSSQKKKRLQMWISFCSRCLVHWMLVVGAMLFTFLMSLERMRDADWLMAKAYFRISGSCLHLV